MIDPGTLKVGDRVVNGSTKGIVGMITDEGNYVQLYWDAFKRPDILSKQSPLWLFLTVERGRHEPARI